MSLDVLALEFTDMQLKYSKEISAFLDKASAFGQDRILVYLYKENSFAIASGPSGEGFLGISAV